MNFDPNSFSNMISSPTPQQYIYQNTLQQQPQYTLPNNTNNNTNPLVSILTSGNNANNNAIIQSLNLPPQLVQQQQQQVQQIQQQQLLQQQQRRSYTQQQIREVQGMIEKCLTMYLTKDEVISYLHNIEPYVIKLVWLKLEEQNPEFFHSYNIRLQIKSQIDMFNTLVKDQASLMSQQQQQQQLQVGTPTPSGASTSPLRQTPTSLLPTVQNNPQQSSQGQFGGNTSSLIYNLLANNAQQNPNQQPTQGPNLRNPSPFQQQPNNINYQLQNQIQQQINQQRLSINGGGVGLNVGGGQRMGSVGNDNLSYLLMGNGMGNSTDLSTLLQGQGGVQQPQQNYQGPMGGGNNLLMSAFGNNPELALLFNQPQNQQSYQQQQYTGPGGGSMNGLDTQGLNMAQQQQFGGNGYNQLQNFQFPPNNNGNNVMNQQQPQNNPMNGNKSNNQPNLSTLMGSMNGLPGGSLAPSDEYPQFNSTELFNDLDDTFSGESGDDSFSTTDQNYSIL